MKKIGIVLGAALLMVVLFQSWTFYISQVEEQPYKVVAQIGDVEIRHYPPARIATVETGLYQNESFRLLAGYIFGGNEDQQEFAMTAPVHTHRTDTSMVMSFVLPEEHWNDELPKPNNDEVQLTWSQEDIVAALRYSGFRSKDIDNQMRKKLKRVLKDNGIEYMGDFRFLGYDPPFKMTDRRNDIIVSVDPSTVPGI